MDKASRFFSEFPFASKEDWLARIAKDLKGKPLDDLYWQLNADIRVDPFAHADDFREAPLPLADRARGWEINEDIDEADAVAANRQALEALAFGADSLCICLPELDYSGFLEQVLNRVYLDHINVNFAGNGTQQAPAAILAALKSLAQGRGSKPVQLRGSLGFNPAPEAGQLRDWRYTSELIQFARAEMPGYRCITIDGLTDFGGPAAVPGELAALLRKGQQCLENLNDRGLTPGEVAAQMQFSVYAGPSYFVEIAKLRAFKLLWLNLLQAWNAEVRHPFLDLRFYPGAYTGDLHSNMICATTMAMSAVLGGANRLTILPCDAGRKEDPAYPRAFARRIARNVQHLLQLETGFNQLADPAAGSFYIEKLTQQFASAAWNLFRNN